MKSLGQGSIAGMRLSLNFDGDLSVSTTFHHLPVQVRSASAPAPRLAHAPDPSGTPVPKSKLLCFWTPEPPCWPCPGPALPPTSLLPLISGCLPTATITPDTGLLNPHPLQLSHAHQGSY